MDSDTLLKNLKTSLSGLSQEEASKRARPTPKKDVPEFVFLKILGSNLISALNLILLGASLFSWHFGDKLNALIIFIIVCLSAFISCIQEFKAYMSTRKIIEAMKDEQAVIRDGQIIQVPTDALVVGDILYIEAGDLIPLDCQLIDSKDIFVNESNLTGESLPQEKHHLYKNDLKMGSCVISGIGKACVIEQNTADSYGKLLEYISRTTPSSSFSLNLKGFSRFLLKVTFIFTSLVFIILLALKRAPLESILFGLSIAVGLSPQLLPAILTTNLAKGASEMAKQGALTKRLDSIENFGNMDVLCCDKTGTLTKGKIEMYAAFDTQGKPSEIVRYLSYLNASFQSGFPNSLDEAILEAHNYDLHEIKKLDEIPYDFERKLLSILIQDHQKTFLISKGALETILDRSQLRAQEKQNYLQLASSYYTSGFRVLGIASKLIDKTIVSREDEYNLCFQGFLLFLDPLKDDCSQTLKQLKELGIRLVMITGDHPLVASTIAEKAGFERYSACPESLENLKDSKSKKAYLSRYDVFARVSPLEKAKIIDELKKMGYTVGFLGDGINDSAALFCSDVGISVESGSDMAKATSDFILLNKNLALLIHAVAEGRKIFNNTMKYILMAVSANFGNMFSMALVSLFIPFLPLLPTQILLINLLQDTPEMGICYDKVDPDVAKKPQRWDISFITRFMILFGLISSLFDFITFFTLRYLNASAVEFRSAWFTESVMSATFIIFFIRSKHPFYRYRPSWILSLLVFSTITLTLLIPYTQLGPIFDIITLPAKYYVAIGAIVVCYAGTVEIAKRVFHKWIHKKRLPSTLSS